jgi:hypothetical protein
LVCVFLSMTHDIPTPKSAQPSVQFPSTGVGLWVHEWGWRLGKFCQAEHQQPVTQIEM